MKSAQIKQLQSEVSGQVTAAAEVREHLSTDASVLSLEPAAVMYPRNVEDVRAAVAFAAASRAKGKELSITARGAGTDLSSGALTDSLMMVFPAHMNKLLRLTKDRVVVQPGINYGALQTVLYTHGRFLPPAPASAAYSTVGGAVSNNAGGEKSLKYGPTRSYVEGLKVVLADGSIIETGKISGRELNRKKGQMTLEGDIYRGIDNLISDNWALIHQSQPPTSKNTAGYALASVKRRDGSFDLTQLFIGAQGTLGLITEVALRTEVYNSRSTLAVAYFDDLGKCGEAVLRLKKLGPSAIELVDRNALEYLREHQPGLLGNISSGDLPAAILLVEFDGGSNLRQNIQARRAAGVLRNLAVSQHTTNNNREQEALWQIRRGGAAAILGSGAKTKAVPLIEDACVPVEQLSEFLDGIYKLLKKRKLNAAVWGRAGEGSLSVYPLADLSKKKDRETLLALADEFYNLVFKLGGTSTAHHGDGIIRAPYLEKAYGADMYELFKQVKQLCDPQGVFNQRSKLGAAKKELEPLLRHEYSLRRWSHYLPHN